MNNKIYQAPDYFTSEQLLAIKEEGNNILVAAAAGCGKTTLMVQRIIRKILDDKVNVNQLVVVTFTEAAASELKERLEEELNKTLDEIDDQKAKYFLNFQLSILDDSYISTFHSLCLRLLKENKAEFNFARPINIADTRTMYDLKRKAFKTLLENHYLEKELQLLDDFYNPLANEENLFKVINNTLNIVNSKGDFESFNAALTTQKANSIFEVEPFAKLYLQSLTDLTSQLLPILQDIIIREGLSDKNTDGYNQLIDDTQTIISAISTKSNYQNIYDAIKKPFTRKGTTKILKADFEYAKLHDQAKAIHQQIKDLIVLDEQNLLQVFFDNDHNASLILHYTKLYAQYLESLKKQTGYLEFDDLENNLLALLYNDDNSFSEVALSLKPKFNEIMIDEYQDTSLVQEMISQALSNGKNIFMVGDIKQSIYRFRNATSALFAQKYFDFAQNKGGQLIELTKNFRSLRYVLESTNFIFKNIFSTTLGGINYDKTNQLNFGNKKLEEDYIKQYPTQLIINKYTKEDKLKKEERWDASAKIAVEKIKELVETNNLKYSDFAILTRDRKGWNVLEKQLITHNISYMMHGLAGFFKTYELKDLINLLNFLANPKNDIALLGVLHSYFCNLNEDDLLNISSISIEGKDYPSLYEKLANSSYHEVYAFLEDLLMHSYTLIPTELIDYIYEKSLYKERIYSQGNFAQFLMAITRFKEVVSTNMEYFNSLNSLVIGIEEALNSNKDDSSTAVLSSQDNVVNIMTIHKSKGLEFKYVIILDEGELNTSEKINIDYVNQIDQHLILTPFNTNQRVKLESDCNPYKALFKTNDLDEIISEELRILYVALTRAKLQLIIIRSIEEEKLNQVVFEANSGIDWLINTNTLRQFKNLSDFIIASISRHANGLTLRDSVQVSPKDDIYKYFLIKDDNPNELKDYVKLTQEEYQQKYGNLFEVSIVNYVAQEVEVNNKPVKTKYPYEVFDIKDEITNKYDLIRPSDHGAQPLDFDKISDFDPFLQGNLTHLLLEKLGFNSTTIQDDLYSLKTEYQIEERLFQGIKAFINDPMFELIKNNIYNKEYSFIYSHNNKMMNGIIDLYVEDANNVYIIDYKTDRLSEDELIEYYHSQLKIYQEVIANTTTKNIKTLIYSLHNQKFIEA